MPIRRTTSGLTVAPPAIFGMPETENVFDRTVREIQDAIARRAYEICESRGWYHGSDQDDWFRAESELLRAVPIEILDEDDSLRVVAEVPGYDPKELDVHLEPDRLLLRGKSQHTMRKEKGGIVYSERQADQIFRAINLPVQVDTERATALLQDGILQLNLPKAESSKATRLQVKAA